MIIAFTLSMPQRPASSNWGRDRLYCVTQRFSTKRGKERAEQIVAGGPYDYHFSDGWGMLIDVRIVGAKEAASLKKRSAGFAGYNWAIDTICRYGRIMDSQQEEKFLEQQKASKSCQTNEIKSDADKNSPNGSSNESSALSNV